MAFSMGRTRMGILVLLAAAVGLTSCGDDDPAGPTNGNDDVVEIRLTAANTFDSDDVTVEAGTTVRWVNDADVFHTVTPDGHAEWEEWTTNREGQEFEHTFESPGEFEYYCEPHLSEGMVGIIRVE